MQTVLQTYDLYQLVTNVCKSNSKHVSLELFLWMHIDIIIRFYQLGKFTLESSW